MLDALNVRNIPKLKLNLASRDILSYFESMIRPVQLRMESNLKQSRTLAALRDGLLPKLMRGKVRVAQLSGLVEGGE